MPIRKFLFLLLFFGFFQNAQSQTDSSKAQPNEDNTVYNSTGIELKPEFPGGLSKFYQFISQNFNTPNISGIKGKVLISFVIEKDGSITDIKVLNDIGFGCGQEAVRVLKKCPNWTPAEQYGKKVRCAFVLPINIESP